MNQYTSGPQIRGDVRMPADPPLNGTGSSGLQAYAIYDRSPPKDALIVYRPTWTSECLKKGVHPTHGG